MRTLRAVGISGSPSPLSRSKILVARTLDLLASFGAEPTLIDLIDLPAEALLGRRRDEGLDRAIETAAAGNMLVLGTPVYRAAYAGQLKAFFDLFPRDALHGRVVGFIATGAGPAHALLLEHALHPLVASLGSISAAGGLYVTEAEFPDKAHLPEWLEQRTKTLAEELMLLGRALVQPTTAS